MLFLKPLSVLPSIEVSIGFKRLVPLVGLVLLGCTADPQSDAHDSAASAEQSAPITVYSSRAEHLIQPLFDAFTQETGIPVRFITDTEAALISRLESEGSASPADILLTVDAGNLWHADQLNLLQPLSSQVLLDNVPSQYRAPNNSWFGLSLRARTMVYSTERVDSSQLSSYEALADEQWAGRLCLRTSKKVYNQSLVASFIARLGEESAERVIKGWVANLAVDPLSSDNRAIEAIEAGICDIALVNTYYFGRMQANNPNLPIAIFWPNQESSGVHVNVSGAGLTKYAPQRAEAVQMLEWLSGQSAQEQFAGINLEFPVNVSVDVVELVAAWGGFQADQMNVEAFGSLQSDAVRLMDRAGYR